MTLALTIRTPDDIAADARAEAERAIAAAIDARIEAQARALGYNSAAHIAGYVNSTVPQWAAEAQAFVAWRDAVWLAAFEQRSAFAKDPATAPPEALIATLPAWRSP